MDSIKLLGYADVNVVTKESLNLRSYAEDILYLVDVYKKKKSET